MKKYNVLTGQFQFRPSFIGMVFWIEIQNFYIDIKGSVTDLTHKKWQKATVQDIFDLGLAK